MRLYSIVYKIRRIEMQQIILGSAGFLLYFIYDINSVRKQNRLLQKFFAAGTILVVLSLFMELWFAWGQCSHRIGRMIGFGIGAMCFLALLIYTLFFALPFEQTYCEENRLRAAYTAFLTRLSPNGKTATQSRGLQLAAAWQIFWAFPWMSFYPLLVMCAA